MATPEKYGRVRIIAQEGTEQEVSIGQLAAALKEERAIIEISAQAGGFYDNPEQGIREQCPEDPICPVRLTLNLKGIVSASIPPYAQPIPETCLKCAGNRVMIAAGLIPQLNNQLPLTSALEA